RASPERPTLSVAQRLEVSEGGPAAASQAGTTETPPRTVPVPRSAADLATWAVALFLAYRLARMALAAARTVILCRRATPNTCACDAWERCRDAFGLGAAQLRWSSTL